MTFIESHDGQNVYIHTAAVHPLNLADAAIQPGLPGQTRISYNPNRQWAFCV